MDRNSFFDRSSEAVGNDGLWRPGVVEPASVGRPARVAGAGVEQVAGLGGLAPGSRVLTEYGDVPVDGLRPGDRVLTRDNGFQPILWLGRARTPQHEAKVPRQAMVQLPPDLSCAGDVPDALILSGEHRVLIASPLAEAMFFANEVLVPARCLDAEGPARPKSQRVAVHLLFAQHEIILAQGHWIESLFVSPDAGNGLPPALAAHLADPNGPGEDSRQTARLCLEEAEALMLVHMLRAQRARRADTAI